MLDIQRMVKSVNVEKLVNQGVRTVKDNLPKIFAVSAAGCLVLGMVETARATHMSDMDILKEEERRATEVPLYENVKLSNSEKFELCWRNYIRAALYGGAGILFIAASEKTGKEKYLAVMSAYELTRMAGEDRKEAEVDILGKDKALEIENEVRQRALRRLEFEDRDVQGDIQDTHSEGKKTLYIEPFTNTPIWATYEDILHAFNYINHKKAHAGVASINDFLHALGARKEPVAEDWGWNEDQPLIEPELSKSELIDDDPSKPATVIYYSIEPTFDYGNDRRQG